MKQDPDAPFSVEPARAIFVSGRRHAPSFRSDPMPHYPIRPARAAHQVLDHIGNNGCS
jgi:hypothetical protein